MEANSRIILVCMGQRVTRRKEAMDDLLLLFQVFGRVLKMIIFSQRSLLKAFIEFSSSKAASRAVLAVHDRSANYLGRVRVFKSPLSQLQMANRFLSCRQFESEEAFARGVARARKRINSRVGRVDLVGMDLLKSKVISSQTQSFPNCSKNESRIRFNTFAETQHNKSSGQNQTGIFAKKSEVEIMSGNLVSFLF